ncbi:putative membrane protein YqhA [Paenibacillus turicensis]|uniref:Membrane protein YqhA n=1 Tax=Paenibacillus turicensis TaxID=160487 RepID=A0ABS4FQC5_9BACL|nr:hypothetical protein [Paenibacillus turicensis]MBP1904781.1 putative membrane protein YqhA [Paenibacillus turicensis]
MFSYQIVMAVLLVVLGIGLFGNLVYKANKSIKYKNDERWQFIQNKASRVIYWYQGLITVVLAVILGVDLFHPFQNSISIADAAFYIFMLLFLQHGIELIALMYCDKKL